MTSWLNGLRNRGIAVQLTALAVVVLAALAIAGPVAVYLDGSIGLAAAALAAGLCLAGAAVALAIAYLLPAPDRALNALLAGMAARMGIPLTFGLAIDLHGGPLAEAGLLYYLVVFYPVTLLAETAMSLPRARFPASDRGTGRDVVA